MTLHDIIQLTLFDNSHYKQELIESHIDFPIINKNYQLISSIDYWERQKDKTINVYEVEAVDYDKARRRAKEKLFIDRAGLKYRFGYSNFNLFYVHDHEMIVEKLNSDGEFEVV